MRVCYVGVLATNTVKLNMINNPSQMLAKKAPVLAAVICLIVAWVMALAPIPLISTLLVIAFNLAALILAVICMNRRRIFPGISVLVGSLVITPVLYFASYPILLALGALGLSVGSKIHQQEPKAQQMAAVVKMQPTTPAVNPVTSFSGKWQGEYVYSTYPPVPFTMDLQTSANGTVEGTSSEKIKVKDQLQAIESHLSGKVSGQDIELVKTFVFNKVRHTVVYTGTMHQESNIIEGKWLDPVANGTGTFKISRMDAHSMGTLGEKQ